MGAIILVTKITKIAGTLPLEVVQAVKIGKIARTASVAARLSFAARSTSITSRNQSSSCTAVDAN